MDVQMAAIEDFDILEIVKGMDMDKMHELLYLMFENDQNSCWLDACIVLIANNRSFQDSVEGYPDSQIRKFTEKYKEAIAVLNDSNQLIQERLEKTREMLQDIQNSTLCYLKQFLKFKPGEPESAFCALLNLVYHDNSKVKENICTSWIWQKNCGNCGLNSKSSLFTKPIITLPKVNDFRPESPVCVYTCSCKTEQEMKLVYKELPNCLIFHFENGAGTENNIPLIFTVNERKYQLTSIVMFKKRSDQNLSHFVTWIRHPFVNMWLDCNDLNTNIVQFSENKPDLELKDVYMCVYEAFDGLGKISHELLTDDEQTQDINAEVIDLLDEGDDLEVISSVAESKTPPDTINCESRTSLDALEIKTKITKTDSKNVILNAYTNNKCAVIVSPNGIKCENKISSINYVSENTSLDAPEVKTKTGKNDSESRISRALNEKNKSPCEILVSTRDISEKCVEDRLSRVLNEKNKSPCEILVSTRDISEKCVEDRLSRVLNEKNKSPCEILVSTRDISEKCVEDRLSRVLNEKNKSPCEILVSTRDISEKCVEDRLSRVLNEKNKSPCEILVSTRDISEKCVEDRLSRVLNEKNKSPCEILVSTRDISEKCVEDRLSRVLNEKNKSPCEILVSTRDISEKCVEDRLSRVLNEKNKSPCEILVSTRDISEKCVEDREIEEMPKNKVAVEEEMPKNKVTVEEEMPKNKVTVEGNSSSSKRQALDEEHKSRKKQKVEEKDSQQNADEKTVAIQKPVIRIESLLDRVVPNVFVAFMEQILRIHERKNS